MAKFQFSGGWGVGDWVLCQVKVKTQSAKICLNFNIFGGRGRGGIGCQEMAKFQFFGRRGVGGGYRSPKTENTQSAKK